jgi:hypothetical protein
MILATALAVQDISVRAIEFNVTAELPPGANGLLRLLNWLLWGVFLACMAAIVASGGKMAWEKWNQGSLQAPKMLLGACVGSIISGSANAILNAVAGG